MKILEDYKGVAMIYLVIAIISIFWISTSVDGNKGKQVKHVNDNKVVISYTK